MAKNLDLSKLRNLANAIEAILKNTPAEESISEARSPFAAPRHAMYVAKANSRAELSPRARQVFDYLMRRNRHQATAPELQKALRVNRNVIAGAVHELKAKGAAIAQYFTEGTDDVRHHFSAPRLASSAAEAAPRRRKGDRKRKRSRR